MPPVFPAALLCSIQGHTSLQYRERGISGNYMGLSVSLLQSVSHLLSWLLVCVCMWDWHKDWYRKEEEWYSDVWDLSTHEKDSVGIFPSHWPPAGLGVIVFYTPSTAGVIATVRHKLKMLMALTESSILVSSTYKKCFCKQWYHCLLNCCTNR